jgi:hypothetical protein
MPQFNSRIWELAKLNPYFILVMFLMLMHDRFLNNFRGRHFRSRISVSPIVPFLLTIMSDTQAFPFFSKGHLLQMLACHGATLHLVLALCGPTTKVNHNMNWRIMHLILGRMVSRIASNPMVVSCFEICSKALQNYPVSIPESPICVEISNQDFVSNVKTIWEMLSLCSILPYAKAILDISRANLSPVQMRTYDKLVVIIIFRRLFESRNNVFIQLCKYFHLSKKYKKQRRPDVFLRRLRERTEQKLKNQTASHDFEVYCYYLSYLSSRVLQRCEQIHSLVDDSIKILEEFFQMMIKVHYTYQKERDSDFFGSAVCTSYFFVSSCLLQEEKQERLLKKLNEDHTDYRKTLNFCASPPVHSYPEWLFHILQKANLLNLPPQFLECLKSYIPYYELSCGCKMIDKFARLIFLVFQFVEWSQSDHPHRHFIFECVSWMKETGRTKHTDLARLLDLQKFQSEELRGFYRLLKKFQKFAQPSMGCSEPTERTLLCFFDKIHMVFSNETFLNKFQELLKTFEKERISWAKNPRNLRFSSSFSWSATPIFDEFLEDLISDPQFQTIIQDISYFRHTNCVDCNKFLDHDDDDGLCGVCANQREIDHEIEMYENDERERYGRRCR